MAACCGGVTLWARPYVEEYPASIAAEADVPGLTRSKDEARQKTADSLLGKVESEQWDEASYSVLYTDSRSRGATLLATTRFIFDPEKDLTARFATLTGVYGGYFGAAQGIILMSLLRFCLPDDLQRLNALKNVLAGVANAVAAILFIAVADVAWEAVGLIAAGSVIGAQVAAKYGRRVPSEVLRWVVVVVATIVAVILIVT